MILGKCNKYLGNFRAFNTPAKFNTNYLSRKSVGQSEKSKRNRTLTPSPDILAYLLLFEPLCMAYFYFNPSACCAGLQAHLSTAVAWREKKVQAFCL